MYRIETKRGFMEFPEFKIDPESPDAVYTQLRNQLRSAVETGSLSDAVKLPPIRSLASAAGVSVGTMERVVGGMVAEGICFRRPRIGVYINRKMLRTRQRRLFYIAEASRSKRNDYGWDRLKLFDAHLYESFQIQTRTYPRDFAESGEYAYEMENLRRERPDCLLINLPYLKRAQISELIEESFPVVFIGDFHLGEIHTPGLNQIREDTAERGEKLVSLACLSGYRDLVMVCGIEKNYYVSLLVAGARRAAEKLGARLRFLHYEDTPCLTETDWLIRKSELVARLIRNGLPEAVIFDGVDGLDSLAKVFRGYGIDPKKEVKLISNKEMVDGGIYLQPDYSLFAERCSRIIRDLVFSDCRYPGICTLSGCIHYKSIQINNLV